MAMHQKMEIHTAYCGIPVRGSMMVQTREKGSRRSREKAKTVRLKACCAKREHVKSNYWLVLWPGRRTRGVGVLTVAVKQTNLMMRKPQTVKKILAPLPRLL